MRLREQQGNGARGNRSLLCSAHVNIFIADYLEANSYLHHSLSTFTAISTRPKAVLPLSATFIGSDVALATSFPSKKTQPCIRIPCNYATRPTQLYVSKPVGSIHCTIIFTAFLPHSKGFGVKSFSSCSSTILFHSIIGGSQGYDRPDLIWRAADMVTAMTHTTTSSLLGRMRTSLSDRTGGFLKNEAMLDWHPILGLVVNTAILAAHQASKTAILGHSCTWIYRTCFFFPILDTSMFI
ncbi:uncharacterized protein CLUP02_13210 [Colletotrichum lupini]|uniref:Uncharacterized protein n=1 Tax=Colletotrichum lupini TaxID=145971 RepID=A0A9Q8T1Y7_9PEZI|nr:uncharacterized protein CLUP02_13210 [Colletotrichum lupini]UQC87691.1 hypothetical protein CLUP02_13210 [Colletotrichum lupini]